MNPAITSDPKNSTPNSGPAGICETIGGERDERRIGPGEALELGHRDALLVREEAERGEHADAREHLEAGVGERRPRGRATSGSARRFR